MPNVINKVVSKVAVKPRSSLIQTVSPCVWYSMHEQTGSSIADKLGNGAAMTLAASGTGTPWANAGWLTPDGTNHYVSLATDAYLKALLRLDDTWGQMLFAIAFYHDGSCTNSEALFSVGALSTQAVGGYDVNINSAMQVQLEMRGVGSTASATTTYDAAAITSFSGVRMGIVLELINNGDNTIDTNLYYNGVLKRTKTAVSMVPNGATAPFGASEGAGYVVGARGTAATPTYDWLINRAGSNGRIYDFMAMKRGTADLTLGLKLAQDFHNYPMEFPSALVGA